MTLVEAVTPYRWTVRVGVQLGVLAAAAYVYAVAELAPIGAMPAIASDLRVSEPHVGMLTAAYALISVVATVPLVRWTRRWPRRRAFILTMVCLTVSQVLSALAPGLGMLAASRVLCAVTHGLMWAIVVPIGTRLVPATHAGRATAAVYVGTSAALVVGNPLTSSMSQAWGWRPTVAALAITAAAVTMVALAVLPAMPAVDEEDAATIPRSPGPRYHGRLIVLCGLTLVGVTAHFTSFTFIVPIIRDVVGIGGPDAAWLLVGYGAFGLVAMALLARAIDQRLRTAVAGSLGVLCLAFWLMSVLTVARSGVVATVLGTCAIVVWGASAAALPPMLQSAAMRVSPGNVEQASALYVTAFQVGIFTGSVTGGLVDQHHGISAVVMVSTALFAVTLAGVVFRGDVFGGQPSSVTVLRS
ncbi:MULTISPECIES: MFS transporter [unclassified Mycobacterium]|uniref:MFS transporter n=1 Tax=unclassified Mycobacterium TaxID=2642494 RepID=UPI0029C7F744|nr:MULTISPECIES: MFS transporter [unclassified Mycobacterium]